MWLHASTCPVRKARVHEAEWTRQVTLVVCAACVADGDWKCVLTKGGGVYDEEKNIANKVDMVKFNGKKARIYFWKAHHLTENNVIHVLTQQRHHQHS